MIAEVGTVISVERTVDYELVRQIVTYPKIYSAISDDNSPSAREWQPRRDDTIFYLLVRKDDEAAGVFTCIPQNSVCYEVHTCLKPRLFGASSLIAAHMALSIMFSDTPCRRIVTVVPEYNRVALQFALKSGMTQFGVNPKSWLKGGVLSDQILLGISKEDVCR